MKSFSGSGPAPAGGYPMPPSSLLLYGLLYEGRVFVISEYSLVQNDDTISIVPQCSKHDYSDAYFRLDFDALHHQLLVIVL